MGHYTKPINSALAAVAKVEVLLVLSLIFSLLVSLLLLILTNTNVTALLTYSHHPLEVVLGGGRGGGGARGLSEEWSKEDKQQGML